MGAVLGVALVVVIIVALIIMGTATKSGVYDHDVISRPVVVLSSLLGELVIYAALLPAMTSFQRLVLQGPGARVGFAYRREEWLTVGAVARQTLGSEIMLIILFFIAGLFALFADMLKTHWLVFIVALPLFLVWVISYLFWTLMLPAAAVGDYLSLKASFRLARGNYSRILLMMLSLALVIFGPQMAALGFIKQAHLSILVTILFFGGLFVLYYLELLIFSAVWALIYGHLSQAKAFAPLEDGVLPDPVI